jgi:hypothetical protein
MRQSGDEARLRPSFAVASILRSASNRLRNLHPDFPTFPLSRSKVAEAPCLEAFVFRRFFGERGGNRTHDPLIKSQMLYLLSYALALLSRATPTASLREGQGAFAQSSAQTE